MNNQHLVCILAIASLVSAPLTEAGLYKPLKTLCSHPTFRQSTLKRSPTTPSLKKSFIKKRIPLKPICSPLAVILGILGGIPGGAAGSVIGSVVGGGGGNLLAEGLRLPFDLAGFQLSSNIWEKNGEMLGIITGGLGGAFLLGFIASDLGASLSCGSKTGLAVWSAILLTAYATGKYKNLTQEEVIKENM